MRRSWLPLLGLLLCGCAASGSWRKPGSEPPAAAREYRDCRALAASAVAPEIGIDQDILATRGNDWQRAQFGRLASERLRQQTGDRAAAIVASCMRAKGFVPGP